MAYEDTEVPVVKSQDAIRKLIYGHKGTGVMLISRPPHEGFEAYIEVEKVAYHVRVMAKCKEIGKYDRNRYARSDTAMTKLREQEERRVWRVLYYHLKAMFEAADSGVIDIRDVIMPYVVLADGSTLSSHIVPRMTELMTINPKLLLGEGKHD